MTTTKEQLEAFIASTPLLSTHEHHREGEQQQKLDLDTLFRWSYVGWCLPPPESTFEARTAWLEKIQFNAYFVWLEQAICRLYKIDKLTPDNWNEVSRHIHTSHQDAEHHLRILQEHAGYLGFIEDCYWDTGSDVGYPDFVTPVYRLDMWLQGFHPDSLTHEGTNAHATYGSVIPDFETYLSVLEQEIRQRRVNLAGLKCASAYQRSIRFQAVSRQEAKKLYLAHPAKLTQSLKDAFGDFILGYALELAAELELPLQIHTGLAKLQGSNPLLLEDLIARHPNNKFVLFHGGFPWLYETAALAHNYKNVWLDLNWLPLISTTAACQALHVYMEVVDDSSKLSWGGDTWTSEEALGAAMAFRHSLRLVLTDKVEDGYLNLKQAERFAEKIMYQNAFDLYGLKRRNLPH